MGFANAMERRDSEATSLEVEIMVTVVRYLGSFDERAPRVLESG